MYQKYTGIILKKHPFGEADELLTIFTREAGKMRCKVVSVRKPTSRLAGHLQSLNEIEFEVASSVTSRGGGSLPVLTSVRALTINNYLRQNLRKFAFALVGIETLYRLTADQQENAAAYDELRHFLRTLGESPDENLIVRKFQLNLLAASGYAFSFHNPLNPPYLKGEENLKASPPLKVRGGGEGLLLTPALEREIDKHIDYVLEREIKSAKILDSLI
ncbi:MAG: DNA repair protein RecO [Candidatus Doudnabacteria bacterium RIFCSPHIGHO2_01_FULL_46_14]|uniref:DNA repair protein RecO n=1 Tax=Candidatus Doudnabacteria bacterium RIFCSPHIGHO2_01_FULL_46_14 TaxID=1817824 RepID=A0A1F5NN90_9BACT|nr:MAG: DNA repair protein RecO [Candidatus Doudnabacteria bacterium RIFCSPHIGHO2_01_FULL_46_14]